MPSTSLVSSVVDFFIFSTVCVATLGFYQYKQLTKKKPEKLPQDDRLKVIVISGCDKGLGRLMADSWSQKSGYLVVALTLSDNNKSASADNLVSIQCDVTSDEQVQAMKVKVQQLLEEKNAVLYCIVNNAGIADPGNVLFYGTSIDIPKRVMDVNFFGQMRVTQALLPLMLCTSKVTGGKILNMSSVCGISVSAANSSYSASKFAVEAWSDGLKQELERFRIQVVKIRPGQINTDIQDDWINHFKKNFFAAPPEVQTMYGGTAFPASVEKAVKTMGNPQSPTLVLDTMTELLLQDDNQKLDSHYWVGGDAKTFWRSHTVLPTHVVDVVKSVLTHGPMGPALPPFGVIAHSTIRVRDLEKALVFYKKLGCITVGPTEYGCQFLQYNPVENRKQWDSLLLLKEDKEMPERKACSDAGMTRLCILSGPVATIIEELGKQGLKPIAPAAYDKGLGIVAYEDPDGFVIYYVEIGGPLGKLVDTQLWWNRRPKPYLFHWSLNLENYKKVLPMFDELGFNVFSDQNKDQIMYNLLAPFDIDPATSVIQGARMCAHPKGGMMATIMEWTNPRSSINETSTMNTITISVSDVNAAIAKAKKMGMHVKDDGKSSYRKFPLYGDVLVATAYAEEGNCPIEFCCFSNHRPF